MILQFSRQSFEKKKTNIKFRENLSSGSLDVWCGWTDGSWADITKLKVAFRNFANAPKIIIIIIIIMHGSIYIYNVFEAPSRYGRKRIVEGPWVG